MRLFRLSIPVLLQLSACAGPLPHPADGRDAAQGHGAVAALGQREERRPAFPWMAAPHPAGLSAGAPALLVTSVAVTQLPLSRLLQALSQQEGLSHDVDECGAIPITLHQNGAELTELLDRIADLTRTRWHLRQQRLSIRCDQPFTRTYHIDYPAIERSGLFTGTSGLPGGSGLSGTGASPAAVAGPTGSQQTTSRHQSRFWDSVTQTVEQWLAASEELSEPTRITETELTRNDQGQAPAGPERRSRQSPQPAAAAALQSTALESNVSRTVTTRVDQRRNQVTAHPESGLLHVRATVRQHRQLATMLASIRMRSRQQVEIEASLLEVRLSRQHERGIQWNLRHLSLSQGIQTTGAAPGLIFSRSSSGEDSTGLALRFLEQFGLVHVVSSPRVVTLHQQAALVRMVENRIYFTVSSQTVPAGPNSAAFSTFSTQAHTTPVGFVMSVLPSVDESGGITLALRPSLSRIIGFVNDPNPGLAAAGVSSRIPEVQIREIESVLKLQDGQVALLGGFIQSESRNTTAGIPGASTMPGLRWLGSGENAEDSHTELVVLIRARLTPQAAMPAALGLVAHENQTGKTAHADKSSRHSTTGCARDIENAIAQANHQASPPSSQPDCASHPWVRQLTAWNVQGMPLETATQWLITGNEQQGAIRLYPQLEGPMEDIARMRAAHTLALNGHLADARRIWTDLSIRRPSWAEVWFNLGLLAYLQGERHASDTNFRRATELCSLKPCSITETLLSAWAQRSGDMP